VLTEEKQDLKAVTGMITQMQRYSVNDGPGIRTTVFLKGCLLRCPWCHNPETWNPEPEIYFHLTKCTHCGACAAVCPVPGAIDLESDQRINYDKCTLCMKCAEVCPYGALSRVGERLSVAEVMDEVERDMPFYVNSGGGMTLSGGEVLYQADFASALLQVARQKGIHTCVDTSGYGTAEDLEKLIPYTDLFLYDIKLMDDKRHKEITGVSNKVIQENARAIAGRTGIHFRIPLIPEINDNEEFFRQLGDFAKSAGVNDIDLLPYHDYASGKYRMLGREELFYKKDLLPDEAVQKFEEQLKGYGLRVTVGG